ncbi:MULTISPECIES: TRAP transporter substrate-binding protein [Oceanobacillus]|uniref:TRAP transporter substrate-binding protein n=1 Tax=Oceanobacillus profundus TaxID=372463 RepID=A0A417YD86_9BACI|nr:TRAP transporter substrate-binding protein [Oceanobacillus profundus]MDO6448658.1 TRAP transporter substrate-binding protein [Oceanobacillus profundus]PAE28867.1 C4-dicarboxylate ABC transporter [Paenibacillus sp. 7884-2]RHW30583.1 TRAP transporter substrate-binding protein [Oceanobacillus profundus]
MKKVKSTVIILLVILAFLSFTLIGNNVLNQNAIAGQSEEITLRLGQSKAGSHPVSIGINKFAELVEEKSNGKITVDTFHDSLLGSDREVIESAQRGSLELASSSTPNMTSFTNYFTAWDLPYIFENKEEVYKAVDGKPGEIIRKEMEKSGFKVIFFPDYGFRQVVNNVRPVKLPKDMAGLKIRTTNSRIEQADFSEFGASPTPVAWSEVFTALQQGTVEGEGNSYSLLWDSKHQEVLNYATEVNYNYSSDIVVMNKDKFDALSKEYQDIIMEAGLEATEWQRDLANEREDEAKQQFIDYGIEIYEPTEEEMKIWKQTAEPVWDQFVKEGVAEPEYVDIILETLGKTREDIFK